MTRNSWWDGPSPVARILLLWASTTFAVLLGNWEW